MLLDLVFGKKNKNTNTSVGKALLNGVIDVIADSDVNCGSYRKAEYGRHEPSHYAADKNGVVWQDYD